MVDLRHVFSGARFFGTTSVCYTKSQEGFAFVWEIKVALMPCVEQTSRSEEVTRIAAFNLEALEEECVGVSFMVASLVTGACDDSQTSLNGRDNVTSVLTDGWVLCRRGAEKRCVGLRESCPSTGSR